MSQCVCMLYALALPIMLTFYPDTTNVDASRGVCVRVCVDVLVVSMAASVSIHHSIRLSSCFNFGDCWHLIPPRKDPHIRRHSDHHNPPPNDAPSIPLILTILLLLSGKTEEGVSEE